MGSDYWFFEKFESIQFRNGMERKIHLQAGRPTEKEADPINAKRRAHRGNG